MKKKTKSGRLSAAFKIGAVELSFLVIGYQAALFIHNVSADSTEPVHVPAGSLIPEVPEAGATAQQPGPESGSTSRVRPERKTPQTFRFNPNTVSPGDLERLGFSEKQAQSIINYRNKGGRFYRASDFAKSYVVSDSIFRRLEPFIDIPATDINAADSAAFDNLPGIGPYYAARMVEYRDRLGGYSFPEQLMEIKNFDAERYEGLKDLICIGAHDAFRLWALDEEGLAAHPYIDKHTAHAIILFRENSPEEEWTLGSLAEAGILDKGTANKLERCLIEPPSGE